MDDGISDVHVRTTRVYKSFSYVYTETQFDDHDRWQSVLCELNLFIERYCYMS
jgi:hypothetical protein